MKKIIYLSILVMLASGCATTSSITPKLKLGMTKDEVLVKCGTPVQSSAIKDKDGQVIESFMYKEIPFIGGMFEDPIYTYVYFSDSKVIYYGNPNFATQSTRREYTQPITRSSDNSYLMQEQINQQNRQQMQQQSQNAWNSASQATQDAMRRNQIQPSTNCYTQCDSFGNCNTNCQ